MRKNARRHALRTTEGIGGYKPKGGMGRYRSRSGSPAHLRKIMSKENLLLVVLSLLLVTIIAMPAGVILAAWFHDPWWLLITAFAFISYMALS